MPVASCSFLEAQFDAKPSQVIRTNLQPPSTSNNLPEEKKNAVKANSQQ